MCPMPGWGCWGCGVRGGGPAASLTPSPRQEKAAFRELIAQLELDPKCKGLPFSSFLILPFQRITRLKLLVQVPPPLHLHNPRMAGRAGASSPNPAVLPDKYQVSSHCGPGTPVSAGSSPAPREPHPGGGRRPCRGGDRGLSRGQRPWDRVRAAVDIGGGVTLGPWCGNPEDTVKWRVKILGVYTVTQRGRQGVWPSES